MSTGGFVQAAWSPCMSYRPEEVLEPDDVPIEVRDVRVVDGPRDVVREEVDDLVVPVEHLEDGLLPFADLQINIGHSVARWQSLIPSIKI